MRLIAIALSAFGLWVAWVVLTTAFVVAPVRKADAGIFQYNVTPYPSQTPTATATATPTP